jgi:hypothetical protein
MEPPPPRPPKKPHLQNRRLSQTTLEQIESRRPPNRRRSFKPPAPDPPDPEAERTSQWIQTLVHESKRWCLSLKESVGIIKYMIIFSDWISTGPTTTTMQLLKNPDFSGSSDSGCSLASRSPSTTSPMSSFSSTQRDVFQGIITTPFKKPERSDCYLIWKKMVLTILARGAEGGLKIDPWPCMGV